jgi:hypothetical protein
MCQIRDPYPYLQGQGHNYYLKDVYIPVWIITLLFIEGFLNYLAQVSSTSRQCVAAKGPYQYVKGQSHTYRLKVHICVQSVALSFMENF